MKRTKFFFELFLIILLFNAFSAYNITKIDSYSDNEFKLLNDLPREKYYKIYQFKNANPAPETHGDLVIQFTKGESFSTKIALYTAVDKIKQNENKEFIDSDLFFEVLEKEIILSKDTKGAIGAGDVFIVIYDLKYVYSDSFRMFNELDIIQIKSNVCIQLPHLYSKEKMTFNLLKTSDSKFVSLSLSSTLPKIPTFAIKDENDQIREYSESNQHDYLQITPKTEPAYVYFVIYKKEGQVYDTEFRLTFCVELLAKKIISITNEATKKKFSYSMPFYFILNLKPYSQNEENGVLLSLDYTVTESIDGFYCKYVLPSDKEDDLINLYPLKEEDNECALQRDDLLDTSFHLFFKYAKKELETLLVLVKVKEKHLGGSSFSISIPKPIKDINADLYAANLDITMPLYYKIDPNKMNGNLIISSSNEIALSIIYGSFSSGKVATKARYHPQLFAVNKKDVDNQEDLPLIFVKLYGRIGKVNFEAKFINHKLIYLGGEVRTRSSYIATINKCSEFVYFIGSYTEKSDEYISIEKIYGKGDVYHRTAYSPSKKIEANLPDEASIKPFAGTVKLWNNVDLMKIKCSLPMSLIINFTPQDQPPPEINQGEVYRTPITKDQALTYDLDVTSTMGFEARLETEAQATKVDVLIDGVIKGQLNSQTKVFRYALTEEYFNKKATIGFKSAEYSVVSFQAGSDSVYQLKIRNDYSVKTLVQYILVELKEIDFYSASIDLSSEEKGLSLCYSQEMTESGIYMPRPKSNCHELEGSYKIKVTNPYDKYITSDGRYFIGIALSKVPSSDVTILLSYEVKPTIYTKEREFIVLNKEIKLITTKKSRENEQKELIAFAFKPCREEKLDYQVLFNKEMIFEAKDITLRTINSVKNNYAENDLALSIGNRIFSYSYVSQEEFNDYKTTTANVKLELVSSNNKTIKLKYAPFMKAKSIQYDFYAVKADEKAQIEDACLMRKLNPIKTEVIAKDEDGLIEKEIVVNDYGTFWINIIASTTEGVIMLDSYSPIEIKVDNPLDPKKRDNTWLWILIGCLVGLAIAGGVVFLIYKIKKDKRNQINPAITEPFDNLI